MDCEDNREEDNPDLKSDFELTSKIKEFLRSWVDDEDLVLKCDEHGAIGLESLEIVAMEEREREVRDNTNGIWADIDERWVSLLLYRRHKISTTSVCEQSEK